MKSSSKIMKIKTKCTHKLSKSTNKPKTTRFHTTNFDNYQTNMSQNPINIRPKQLRLKNDQNHNLTNYELCKQTTLCYCGLKEVIKIEAMEKDSKKLKEQDKKLKEQNMIYEEYFRQFKGRFKEQKEEIKKIKNQNLFLKSKNAQIQQLNSTLSGNTATARTHSHKQSYTTRSTPKYMY